MRSTIVYALFGLLPTALAAEVIVVPRDGTAPAPSTSSAPTAGFEAPTPGLDSPTPVLIVPFYEIDTEDPAGTTTLFAVRNVTAGAVDVQVTYHSQTGVVHRQDDVLLEARETLSINIRDVAGLPADPDGFARGYVVIESTGDLVGDYLQVDVDDAFATGERMVGLLDLCQEIDVRFMDFGTPTELRFLVNDPRGHDVLTDPPSVVATVLSEDGTEEWTIDIYTNAFSFQLTSEFAGQPYGTLVFDFTNSNGGYVYAESSADGRFSVGLNGACTVP